MKFCEKEIFWIIGCVFTSIVLSITYGFTFFESNQNTYLLGSLDALGIDSLDNDWLVSVSKIYHSNFSYVIGFLSYLPLKIANSAMILDFLIRFLSFLIFLLLLAPKKNSIEFTFVVGLLIVFDGAYSVAGTYLFGSILQPSSLGAAFAIVSCAAYIRKKYLISSILVICAGFFHANFLILMVPVLSGSFLICLVYGKEKITNGLALIIPMGIFLVFQLPEYLGYIALSSDVDPDYIFQFVRSPHHYNTLSFIHQFTELLGWLLLGIAGLLALNKEKILNYRLASLYTTLAGALLFALIFTSYIYIPFVSKVFIWRVAPIFELLSYAILALFLVNRKFILNKNEMLIIFLGLMLVILGKVEEWPLVRKAVFVSIFLTVFSIYFVIAKSIDSIITKISLPALVILFSSYGIYSAHEAIDERSKFGINVVPEELRDIYGWIRENSTYEDVFQTPLYFEDFRLQAQRPMVVDWKSTPVDPAGLVEWYERVLAVTCVDFGYYDVGSLNECYRKPTQEKISVAVDNYMANYFIYSNEILVDFLIPVYIGNFYTIYSE